VTWADLAYDAAAVLGVLGLLGGLLVPELIRRIPEPAQPAADKEPYADIGRSPGLRWRSSLTAGVAAGSTAAVVGWSWSLPFLLYLAVVGTALAVVDWRTRLLPTKVVAPSYAVVGGLVLLAAGLDRAGGDLLRSLAGWAISGGIFWLMWRIYPRGMGYGDVRLSGVLGIALGYLGWGELLVGVYSGFILGALVGTVLSLLRLVDRKAYPFGPFMLLGAWVGVLLGQWVWDLYLGTL
jgi:leader peptidase (prepilin peptidase) / N-methyltransferase